MKKIMILLVLLLSARASVNAQNTQTIVDSSCLRELYITDECLEATGLFDKWQSWNKIFKNQKTESTTFAVVNRVVDIYAGQILTINKITHFEIQIPKDYLIHKTGAVFNYEIARELCRIKNDYVGRDLYGDEYRLKEVQLDLCTINNLSEVQCVDYYREIYKDNPMMLSQQIALIQLLKLYGSLGGLGK